MFKLVLALVILAFAIRMLFIFQGSVSFHYDMARDAFEARQIWKEGNLKIVGPPTTTEGLFSGVLYYYFLAIPYGLSGGDPRVAAIFMSLVNSLAIIPIFFLAKDLFKSNKWAIIASFFYAVSFEAVQYGPWLSNPSPAIFTVACFFYSLRRWQKRLKWGLPLTVLFASLSAQMEFFLIFLFVVILAFKLIFKIKVTVKQYFLSALLILLIMSTFLISAIKFNSLASTVSGFLSIPQGSDITFRIKFTESLFIYLNRLSDLFINNFFPVNVFLGGSLTFATVFILIKNYSLRNKFILFCLFCNLPIFFFGGQNATYTMVGMVVPAILAVCVLVQKYPYLIVLILLANLYMIFMISPKGQVLLVIPKDMILQKQLALIDKTYQLSGGQPFSINSLTLPLWTNTTWAYLYSWYGKNKYGYVPSYLGHDQVGLLGADSLPRVEKPLDKTFFIIEPHEGIPDDRFQLEIGSENSKTDLINEIKYGELKLQIRQPKTL